MVPKRSVGNEQRNRLSKEKVKRMSLVEVLSFENQPIKHIFTPFSHMCVYVYICIWSVCACMCTCVYLHMRMSMCWVRMKRTTEINIVVRDLRDTGMKAATRTVFNSPGSDRVCHSLSYSCWVRCSVTVTTGD